MDTSGVRSGDSPDALFARWRDAGDAGALGRLFDATAADLFRIATTLAADAATAEDAVQETFLAAIEFAPRWDPSRPVVPWLVGILRHKVEALRRDRRRAPDAERLPTRLPPLDPRGIAELREEADRVRVAMDALPEPFRQAALLRWRHGLEPAEIAHLTGESPGAIRVRLHRALSRLRERVRGGAALALIAGPEVPARGIADVRRVVLRRAATAGRVTVAGAVAGGLLVGKKIALAASFVVALAAAVWWAAEGGGGPPAASTGAHETASQANDPTARAARPDAGGVATPAETVPPSAPIGPAISGRVVDPAGRAVTGARVVAVVPQPGALIDTAEAGSVDASGTSAVTDADGRFRLPAAADAAHDLVVVADGFAPASRESVRAGDVGDVRLAAETTIAGRATSADGGPVAGATVRVVRLAGCISDVRAATTDAEGRFRVAASGAVLLDVRAAGFAPLQTEFAPPRDDAPLDVVLFRGVPLEVLVIDAPTGAPVEGADVRYGLWATPWTAGARRGVPRPLADLDRATTGSDGRAVFAHAPAERATSWLFVRAWKSGRTAEAANVTDGGETGRMTARIETWPGATVRGRVVDTTGAPVAGCAIRVEPDAADWFPAPFGERPWLGAVLTGADGRFVRRAVRGGIGTPYRTRVVVPPPWGDRGADVGFAASDRKTVPFESLAGAECDVGDVVLGAPRPLPRAEFVVRDSRGVPVEGARVVAAGALVPEFVAAADGHVVVRWSADPSLHPPPTRGPGGAAPTSQRVRVLAAGFAPTVLDVVPSATTPPEVPVTLAPARRLAGRVLEPDGRVVGGAKVWAVCGAGERAISVPGRADAAGRFVVDDLPDGPLELHACAASDTRGSVRETVVRDVVAGGPDVDVVLVPDVCATGRIEGVVRDADSGAPVVGAAVEVGSRPFPVAGETSLVPAGSIRLDDVPAGTWTVRVRARGCLAEDVEVVVPSGGVARFDAPLARGGVIAGRVKFPDGTPVQSARVDLVRTDLGPGDRVPPPDASFAWLAADGGFQIAGVRPGSYRLVAKPSIARPQCFVARDPVVVAAGRREPVAVDVAPDPAGCVVIRLNDPAAPAPPSDEEVEQLTESQMPPGATIEILDAEGRRHAIARRAYRGGGASFAALPGSYEVVLHVPGADERRAQVEVRANTTSAVDFGAR